MTTLTAERRAALGRRAQWLALATVLYNTVEAFIAISAGKIAGSVGLVGFRLDSIFEVSSGLIILWQFRHAMPESREQTAQKAMAFGFAALALFVGYEAISALVRREAPDVSWVGMLLAALSVVIMPFLSYAQRSTGRELGSGSVVADSTQTLLCTYLSVVLLVGLGLNALFGWWWADPIAALALAAVAAREGWQAWHGEGCCAVGNSGTPCSATPTVDDCCSGNVATGPERVDACADGCCSGEHSKSSTPQLVQLGRSSDA